MFKKKWTIERRIRRKKSIKTKMFGTIEKPRLSVFRSNKYIYVQAIDDNNGTTLASASSIAYFKDKKAVKLNKEIAKKVGEDIAEELKKKKIETVVFDRNGYLYTGKVKILADAAREKGIKF